MYGLDPLLTGPQDSLNQASTGQFNFSNDFDFNSFLFGQGDQRSDTLSITDGGNGFSPSNMFPMPYELDNVFSFTSPSLSTSGMQNLWPSERWPGPMPSASTAPVASTSQLPPLQSGLLNGFPTSTTKNYTPNPPNPSEEAINGLLNLAAQHKSADDADGAKADVPPLQDGLRTRAPSPTMEENEPSKNSEWPTQWDPATSAKQDGEIDSVYAAKTLQVGDCECIIAGAYRIMLNYNLQYRILMVSPGQLKV